MVVFTCNNCGETLQKPKVAKHCQFKCRGPIFLTCVDCLKDFRADEYVAHTKCITEEERYGGKNYTPKNNANKGEKRQQEWLHIVQGMLENSKDLSNAERNFLNVLTKYKNLPRKKAKFLNFVQNAMHNRTNKTVIESVWDKMETARKLALENGTKQESTTTDRPNGDESTKTSFSEDLKEYSLAENENNENICKEKDGQQQNTNTTNDANNDAANTEARKNRKKKSRKRELSESSKKLEDESLPKKRNDNSTEDNIECLESQCDNISKKSTFEWKNVILNILLVKKEISLNKLQKKVLTQYVSHCGDTITYEKAASKFNKKLKKIPEIMISENKVRLA